MYGKVGRYKDQKLFAMKVLKDNTEDDLKEIEALKKTEISIIKLIDSFILTPVVNYA